MIPTTIVPNEAIIAQSLPSVEEVTHDLSKRDGFFPIYWDDDEGKVLIEIDEEGGPFLYHTALAGGLGSNDVGLDRGLLGPTRVVHFERVGRRVLLFEENLRFRATSENEEERAAVANAFAPAVVFGFDVVGRTGARLVVDATRFVVRDAMDAAGQLKDSGQGDYTLDSDRSVVNPDVLRSFPDNTELEAWLTFSNRNPGNHVREAAADAKAVTLRVRHSLIRLPDDGYQPRVSDPRSGYFGITYVDYATPVASEKEKRFIARHRIEIGGNGEVSPIVYYLDRGVPEPIRSALLDGARWWSEAFDAAGLPGAFRVEMLPAGADALDVRYNVIQWVHRATRGWSWGDVVVDPRTGEILKGYVALGSLRIRQDYLLAQGLLGQSAIDPKDDPMLALALARIRQLSAHEVGHTLGLNHNFAASISDRASVMDYPAPFVRLDASGDYDYRDAYDVGIGEYDKYAIRYGYTVFDDPESEREGLGAIIDERREAGLEYITDRDARPPGGAHPDAHLWDNESDVLQALDNEMALRRAGLSAFGVDRLPAGRPLATLEDMLVPLYLRHRYQIEAVVKLIGGVWYEYAIAGESSMPVRLVAPEMQRAALDRLISTVSTAALRIPDDIRSVIPPRPPGYPPTRELFSGDTGLTFDAYAPAVSIADFVFGLLLHRERAARLAYQTIEDPDQLGLEEVFATVRKALFTAADAAATDYDEVIHRIVQDAWVRALIQLGLDVRSAEAASMVHAELTSLSDWLRASGPVSSIEIGHRKRLAAHIDRFLLREFEDAEPRETVEMPPGSPIGFDPE